MFFMPIVYCCLLSLLSGPIGCLILWSRLTFFGETIAHAAIFGLFLSLYLGIPMTASMSLIVLTYCLLIEFFIDEKVHQSYLLPIFSYGVLGLGFVLIEKFLSTPSALFNVLLGDILLITFHDVLSLSIMVALIWGLWLFFHRHIILTLLMPDLAILKKINLRATHFAKNLVTGLAIAFVIQAAGMLLSMALLTIPPLTAKMISKTPYQMVIYTCVFSFGAIFLGFSGGIYLDASLGAMMSTCALALFIIVKVITTVMTKRISSQSLDKI